MALQQNIFVSGKIGNLIFYDFRGKPSVRSMPAKIKQTRATRDSAKLFGKAASIARSVRHGLLPLHSDLSDRTLMNRLNGAMLQCLKTGIPGCKNFAEDLPFLKGFAMNTEREISWRTNKTVKAHFNSEGKLVVTIPAFNVQDDLSAPAGTKSIILKAGACSISWEDPADADSDCREVVMPYTNSVRTAEEWVLPVSMKKARIVVMAAAFRYHNGKELAGVIQKKVWMPAGIIGAWWTGK
jgi:hypothetical protein